MRRPVLGACALLLLGSLACDGFFDVGCQADRRPGIEVTVLDSITGVAVPETVTAAATSGAYADSVVAPGEDFPFVLADGRPGTYTVDVTAPGYAPWSQGEVVVPERTSGCVARRLRLRAWLQPEGTG